MNMIIIPVVQEPEKCPHCEQDLVEITVCKSCKKELPEEELTFLDLMRNIVIFILLVTAALCGFLLFIRFIAFPLIDLL